MSSLFRAVALSASLLLAACATRTPPQPVEAPRPPVVVAPPPIVEPPAPPPPSNARVAGLALVPPTAMDAGKAERALAAFRASCPAMLKRRDNSQLTTAADWQPVCAEASSVPVGAAAAFFRDRFDWLRVGTGEAFATGYYEPEIRGSRTRIAGYDTPVYSLPADLTRCTRADGQTGRGRVDQTGACVLYFTRADIEDGALAGRGLEMAWVADPIDLFFLQIQGSGRLILPDGGVMRIGYENQNGREYVAIGRLLRERGILAEGKAGMKEIVAWMRANPAEGRALMRENLSYIFFRELTGPGPLGAMGVAVTPQSTVATDPLFVPLGAPVVLSMERAEASGIWIAQDTGGAIKGANRFDTFWGAGAAAEATAGGMSSKGSAILLLPKGAAARAQALR